MPTEGIGEHHTLTADQQRILQQIRATFDYMPSNPEEADMLAPWLDWQVDEILDRVPKSEYQTVEKMALVGLLGPVFARFLSRGASPRRPPPVRPVSHLRRL